MNEQLKQSEFEELSAWLDGELSAERSAEVERHVREDVAWARAAAELRAIHEAMDGVETPPAPDAGLARRIIAGVHVRELTETEAERLSAYVDGELAAEACQVVERNIQTDPAWREALRDLQEIDSLLDGLTVPAAPAGLAGRISQAVHKDHRRRRAFRVGS